MHTVQDFLCCCTNTAPVGVHTESLCQAAICCGIQCGQRAYPIPQRTDSMTDIGISLAPGDV